MTRTQAVILAILIGLVTLVFIVLIVLLVFPFKRLSEPAPAPTLSSPPTLVAITPTPVLNDSLPTASLETPVIGPPTATNTRVPTVTPRLSNSAPTPTIEFQLPTPIRRPTATPPPTPVPPPTVTRVPPSALTPTLVPRQYSVSFKADPKTIERGKCTDLKWRVQGATSITLDGRDVNPSGSKEVCPTRTTSYKLTIQLPNSAALDTKRVEVKVVESPDDATATPDSDD